MIDNFLDDFKAYVTKNKEDMTALQFSFLPPEIFYAVPEEDRELFVKIYNIFANWANEEIKISSICDKHMFRPIDEITLSVIQNDIQNAMHRYECERGRQLKQVLAACLGTYAAITLPKELLDRLQTLTGIKRAGMKERMTWHTEDQ